MADISKIPLGDALIMAATFAAGILGAPVTKSIWKALKNLGPKKGGFLDVWPSEVLKQPVKDDTTYLSLSRHYEMCKGNLEPLRTDVAWIKERIKSNDEGIRDMRVWYNGLGERLDNTATAIRESMENAIGRIEIKIDNLRK